MRQHSVRINSSKRRFSGGEQHRAVEKGKKKEEQARFVVATAFKKSVGKRIVKGIPQGIIRRKVGGRKQKNKEITRGDYHEGIRSDWVWGVNRPQV